MTAPDLNSRLREATVRDGDDEWHIECRFADGQKFAAVTVVKEAPGAEAIAHDIALMLTRGREAADALSRLAPGGEVPLERQREAWSALVAFARAAAIAIDDGGETRSDGSMLIEANFLSDVNEAWERLDALPDDKPGYTLGIIAKAEWSMRDFDRQSAEIARLRADLAAANAARAEVEARATYALWRDATSRANAAEARVAELEAALAEEPLAGQIADALQLCRIPTMHDAVGEHVDNQVLLEIGRKVARAVRASLKKEPTL
jgi:hypothetical protein